MGLAVHYSQLSFGGRRNQNVEAFLQQITAVPGGQS